MKKNIITLIVCLSFSIGIGQQEAPSNKQLQNKIDSLGYVIDNLQKKIIQQDELKGYWQRDIDHINKVVDSNEIRENKLLDWLGVASSILTVIVTIMVIFGFTNLWSYQKRVKEKIEKFKEEQNHEVVVHVANLKEDIKTTFEDIKKENEDLILRLLKNEKWSMDIKEKSNLIVINPESSGDNSNFLKVLKKFNPKFSKSEFSNIDGIKKAIEDYKEEGSHNIVVLENSDGNWTLPSHLKDDSDEAIQATVEANAIIDLIKKYRDINLIYIGSGIFPLGKGQVKDRISYSNAASKLYSNILDTLKFMDILDPIDA